MKKTIKSQKVFGVFVALAIVLAGAFTASYYLISNKTEEDRPPQLNFSGKYQAFSKEGLQGFLKYEESDQKAFDKKYKNTDKKSITLKEGVNYVYVNKQTEIIDIIECIDPVAERILIAQYKPEDKIFYTFPKGPFGAKTEEFASVHQKLNPTEGFIVISRREAKAYCLKGPKAKAENKVNEPNYGGWVLVASNDDKVKDLVKDFEERVKVAWIMKDDDSFKKAPDFETELKDYYLVWLNMDAKPCVPEKEPYTVLMDYAHAIGSKNLAKLYKELPPSYQAKFTDLVNKEVKEILDNAKVKEIAPNVSGILKGLAQSVKTDFDGIRNVLRYQVILADLVNSDIKEALNNTGIGEIVSKISDILIFKILVQSLSINVDEITGNDKAVIVDDLNMLAAIADLLSKLATENPINIENILATDIVLLLAQAEGIADKIAADDLYPGFKNYYSKYKEYLNVFKNATATAKDTQLEKATVMVESKEETMVRVLEENGSCYWVPEGLSEIMDEIDTDLKPELKELAEDINEKFTPGLKAQTVSSLADLKQGVQDFNDNGKACELMEESLTAYADIVDKESIVKVLNETVVVNNANEIDLEVPGSTWIYQAAGPYHGTYNDKDEIYTPSEGYKGEDWILYITAEASGDQGAILYCLDVVQGQPQ